MAETIFYDNNNKHLAFNILIREGHVILEGWAKRRCSSTKLGSDFQQALSKYQVGWADSFIAKCWLTYPSVVQ